MSLSIRLASTDDIPAIALLHVEGWKGAYGGIVSQDYLDGLDIASRMKDWEEWMKSGETTVLLAEEEGESAGFIAFGRTKTVPPGSSPIRPSHAGEIYALYILPAHWRKGIGAALLREAAIAMKEKKMPSLCLWVLDANERAKGFYQKMGGQKLGGKTVRIGPDALKEVCYGWKDTAELRV
jgi:ribosomal protein S18 acetylase RimI-like enzyme